MSFKCILETNDDDLGYAAVLTADNPNNVPYLLIFNTGKIQWKIEMVF